MMKKKAVGRIKIVPYAPFEISPAAQSLHYGQAVLEV